MIRILHVDDNPEDQEITKYQLQHHAKDFEIEWAGTATEALQALDRGVFDCILCDYMMPKIDGLELLRKFREKGDETPFIFLTCQGSEEVAAQALRAGAGDYFTKDVGFAHYERIANSIRRVAAAREQVLQQRQTEKALRESEEWFRALTESTSDWIWEVDVNGVYTYVGPRIKDLLGYELDEIVGKTPFDLMPPQVAAPRAAAFQETMKSREPMVGLENVKLHKEGREVVLETSGVPIFDTEGKLSGYRGVDRDITERKRSEKVRESIYRISEAANAAKNLQELFGSIHGIIGELMPAENFYIALHNHDTDMLSFPYFVDQFDETPAPKELGKGLTEYVLRTGRPLLATPDVFERLVEKGEVESIGAPSIDWLGVPLRTPEETIGVLVVQTYTEGVRYGEEEAKILEFVSAQVAMATERKRAEEALRRREEEYKTLNNHLPIGVYRTTAEGRFLHANPALATILGYESVEDLKKISAVKTYSDPDVRNEQLAQWRDRGGVVSSEIKLNTKNGKSIWVQDTGRVILDENGEIDYIDGTIEDITERKRAEEKLRDQQAILRLIIDTNPNCIFTKDREGRFTLVNKATAEVFGTTVEYLTGRTESEFTDRPDEVERFLKDDLEVIESLNEKIIPEEKLTTASGQVRFYQTVKRPLIDKDGNANQVLGIATDITERKKAEEEIRNSEERYRKLFEHARDGIVLADAITGEIIDCNQAAANLVERSKADLIGQHQTILHPPDDTTDGFSESFKKHIKDSEGEVLEARVITKAGEIKDVDIKANLLDVGGRKLLQGMFRDVTERKRSDEAIMEKAARLELIAQVGQRTTAILELDELLHQAVKLIGDTFDYVNVIIMLVDGDYLVLRATTLPSIQTLEGRLRLRVGSEGITGWVAGNGEPLLVPDVSLDDRYYSVLEAQATKSELAVPIKLKGKVIGVLDTQSTELNTFSEADVFTLQTIADQLAPAIDNARLYEAARQEITDRKLAEKELKRSHNLLEQRTKDLEAVNRELEAFSYSVSHDLRAPLRHISGFSQALIDNYADKLDEKGGEYLQRVIANSIQMNQLIDGLLRLSRLTSGELSIRPVDLSALTRTVAEKLQSSKPERKVGFEIADGLVANADAQLMQILLENLLGNAWKFTEKNKDARIEFGATEREGKREFYVKDNGVGFDPAYADKVFVAFQRIHTGSEFKGTGIGLATVQRIVHRHGGRVWAESEVGKGATFYFTIS